MASTVNKCLPSASSERPIVYMSRIASFSASHRLHRYRLYIRRLQMPNCISIALQCMPYNINYLIIAQHQNQTQLTTQHTTRKVNANDYAYGALCLQVLVVRLIHIRKLDCTRPLLPSEQPASQPSRRPPA